MKKILITGAAGFWGYHLASHLVKRGYEVTGTYHGARNPALKNISWLALDVTDGEKVAETIRDLRPDAVCHLAGQSSLRLSWKFPEKTFLQNTISTVHLLSAIRQFSPATRLVLTSSIHVFGRMFYAGGRPLTENDFTWPDGPYGMSKRIAEFACLDFNRRFGTDCVAVRPVNCIGAHLSDHFVFSDWSRQIAAAERAHESKTLKVGNLDVSRDFLYITDAVKAYEKVMRAGKAGQIYNLSSGKAIPLRRYMEKLVKWSKVPVKIEVDKSRFRRFDPAVTKVSSRKLRSLGWAPKKTAVEGLSDLLSEWRVNHG